jgi:hypothetical protein
VLVIVPLAAIKMSNLDNFRWWAWTWDGCVLFIQCKRNQRKLNWVREIYIPVVTSESLKFKQRNVFKWWRWCLMAMNHK